MRLCKELRGKFLSHLKEEETPPFTKEFIRKHLGECSPCQAKYRELERTDLLLETARLPVPKKAPDRVLSRIARQPRKSTRRVVVQGKPQNRWVLPAAAAVLFSLVLYFALRSPDPVRATLNIDGATVVLSVESGEIDLETAEGRQLVGQGDVSRIKKPSAIVRSTKKSGSGQIEELAWSAYSRGSYEEALDSFRKALALREKEKPVVATAVGALRTGMGWCLYFSLDYESASLEFGAALARAPESADAQRGLGYCHFRLGDYGPAITTLEPVGKKIPTWIDVQLTLGWSEYWLGNYSASLGYFGAARKLNPFLAEPAIGLGWSYYKNDQAELAKSTFARALHLYPDYFKNEDFQTLLSFNSHWLGLHLSVGWAYYNKMNYRQAEEAFLSFLEKLGDETNVPLVANTRCGLGWTFYQEGKRVEAEEQFDLALAIAPTDSNALLGKQLCLRSNQVPKEN